MSTNVLMLGWEYPPHISGGLGTACQGLTTALAPLDVRIQFVVPTLYGIEDAPHMRLVDPDGFNAELPAPSDEHEVEEEEITTFVDAEGTLQTVTRKRVRLAASQEEKLRMVRVSSALSPYLSSTQYDAWVRAIESRTSNETWEEWSRRWLEHGAVSSVQRVEGIPPSSHYGHDLISEVSRYAARVVNWSLRQPRRPDVVHAHDWMTFPAAAQVARVMGVPLVAHVHSLEQDRSGGGANPAIASIEGAGLRSADRVIAVSHYTARQINELHGVPMERIDVVHNGVYATKTVAAYRDDEPESAGPTVLFLGRITFQKGPDYFVEAAARVHSKIANARFVMAGAGDMLPRMRARVAELGLEEVFSFPGFVRGADVERLFSTADVYVMPSVSEPFGISALEAMSYETPVILSRQSGASEILRHALKVDFWDVSRLAAQIIAVLTYPELQKNIVDMAREEVRRVHWEAAAQKVTQVYRKVLGGG